MILNYRASIFASAELLTLIVATDLDDTLPAAADGLAARSRTNVCRLCVVGNGSPNGDAIRITKPGAASLLVHARRRSLVDRCASIARRNAAAVADHSDSESGSGLSIVFLPCD
jgi:hypothetical protein